MKGKRDEDNSPVMIREEYEETIQNKTQIFPEKSFLSILKSQVAYSIRKYSKKS